MIRMRAHQSIHCLFWKGLVNQCAVWTTACLEIPLDVMVWQNVAWRLEALRKITVDVEISLACFLFTFWTLAGQREERSDLIQHWMA